IHQLPQQQRRGGGGGRSPAELREIRRLAVLRPAAGFGASRPDVKSADVLTIAVRWLAWVEQPDQRGGATAVGPFSGRARHSHSEAGASHFAQKVPTIITQIPVQTEAEKSAEQTLVNRYSEIWHALRGKLSPEGNALLRELDQSNGRASQYRPRALPHWCNKFTAAENRILRIAGQVCIEA